MSNGLDQNDKTTSQIDLAEFERRNQIKAEIEHLTPRLATRMLLRLHADHLTVAAGEGQLAIDWVEQLLRLQTIKGEWLDEGRLIT